MRLVSSIAALLLVAASSAQAEPPAVPDAYDLHPLNAAGAAQDIARCMNGIDGARAAAFVAEMTDPAAAGRESQLSQDGVPAVAIASRGQWACVQLSPAGFPVWPVESLRGVIVPVGAPAADVSDWRRRLLQSVASGGVGRGVIIYRGGTVTEVSVSAEPHQALRLKFESKFVKRSELDLTRYVAALDNLNTRSLRLNSQGPGPGLQAFAIPSQRLRRPLDGEFVALDPNETTENFDFGGTRWKFNQIGSEFQLQPDGTAAFTSAPAQGSRTSTGRWQVNKGVLQISLGVVRYAAVLAGDKQTLRGEGRRPETPASEEEDGDRRWSFTLERVPPT